MTTMTTWQQLQQQQQQQQRSLTASTLSRPTDDVTGSLTSVDVVLHNFSSLNFMFLVTRD